MCTPSVLCFAGTRPDLLFVKKMATECFSSKIPFVCLCLFARTQRRVGEGGGGIDTLALLADSHAHIQPVVDSVVFKQRVCVRSNLHIRLRTQKDFVVDEGACGSPESRARVQKEKMVWAMAGSRSTLLHTTVFRSKAHHITYGGARGRQGGMDSGVPLALRWTRMPHNF